MMRGPIVTVAVLILTTPVLTGCFTLLGGGVGYLIDSGRPASSVASRADLVAQDQDKPVVVVDRVLTVHRGLYQGVRSELGEEFAAAYERWRTTLPDSLKPPQMRQRLAVHVRTNGQILEFPGYLAGADRDTAYFKTETGGRGAAWKDIERWTDALGNPFPGPLPVCSPERGLPSLGSVRLRAEESGMLETVPWSDISTVMTARSGSAVTIGLAVGAAIDLVVIAACLATQCFEGFPFKEEGGNWFGAVKHPVWGAQPSLTVPARRLSR